LCGAIADADSAYSYENGRVCIDCGAFTCYRCFVAAPDTMPTHDPSLCIACNSAPLPNPPNGGNVISFPGAPTSTTPSTETRWESIHQKLSPRRVTAAGREERAMNTPFDDNDTTVGQPPSFVLGTSVHPGCIDMPTSCGCSKSRSTSTKRTCSRR
jgi:hypothetical protein